MYYKQILFFIFVLITAFFLNLIPSQYLLFAQSVDELQSKIAEHNKTIDSLQREIDNYQNQINAVGKQADSLSNHIKTLDLSKKELQTNISLTQNKIDSVNLQIEKLKIDITHKEGNIEDGETSVANALKQMNQHDARSLPEILLSGTSLSTFWNEIDSLERFQAQVQHEIISLQSDKKNLEVNKTDTEKKKAELVTLRKQLSGQKTALEDTINDEQNLLKETKNKEANYKTLVANKQQEIEAFEEELKNYESQLKVALDPNAIPKSGTIFRWPLDKVYITQYFGDTPFATANPQTYSGQGHNGIDLRASIGTPVKAVMGGVVWDTGNTGLVPKCLSYGKWVLVKHPNGLSSLYAHLSAINVKAGDTVSTGDVIALSGNTGNVTGPHLHLTVFDTQGVTVGSIPKTPGYAGHCLGAKLPISATHAYLNPLSYLPAED